jgi:hypothetical protein
MKIDRPTDSFRVAKTFIRKKPGNHLKVASFQSLQIQQLFMKDYVYFKVSLLLETPWISQVPFILLEMQFSAIALVEFLSATKNPSSFTLP